MWNAQKDGREGDRNVEGEEKRGGEGAEMRTVTVNNGRRSGGKNSELRTQNSSCTQPTARYPLHTAVEAERK